MEVVRLEPTPAIPNGLFVPLAAQAVKFAPILSLRVVDPPPLAEERGDVRCHALMRLRPRLPVPDGKFLPCRCLRLSVETR